MLKYLSFLVVVIGMSLVSYGGYQYIETNISQSKSLEEAREVVAPIPTSKQSDTLQVANSFRPKTGEVVGILAIPTLSVELPIVEGTNEDDLEKGVGHYKGSAYPMQNDQIVLSGHRDTVFRKMEDVKIGDEFIVKLHYGEFTYTVTKTEIVEANDRTIIHSTAPNEILTVTTCYPFSYIGDAPQRYIITALPNSKKPS